MNEPPPGKAPGKASGGGSGAGKGAGGFWRHVPLEAMSDTQWESLCDGCGRCCLQKLEDEDTGEVHFTRIACRELDPATARCRHYPTRFERVPDCLSVRPLDRQKLAWLPSSCAYRRLAEGRGLADWHPLVSGCRSSVAEAGISVAGATLDERRVAFHRWPEHIIELGGERREPQVRRTSKQSFQS